MLNFLFGLRGRISRGSFCLFASFAFGTILALMAALYAYDISAGNYENGGPVPWPSSPLGIVGAMLWLLVQLLLFGSIIAVSIKRLHDRNKAWWWLVVYYLLTSGLFALGEYWERANSVFSDDLVIVFRFAAIAALAWVFVDLACLRGSSGDNRFGPDPLQRSA